MSARELRKQVLLARIALQRVEFHQDVGLLRERMSLPTIAKQAMRSHKLTSALLGIGLAIFKRFAGSKHVVEHVGRRVPKSRIFFKIFGLAMALWPLVKFGREGLDYIRTSRRAGGWRR
jgi:hypothetical protein